MRKLGEPATLSSEWKRHDITSRISNNIFVHRNVRKHIFSDGKVYRMKRTFAICSYHILRRNSLNIHTRENARKGTKERSQVTKEFIHVIDSRVMSRIRVAMRSRFLSRNMY